MAEFNTRHSLTEALEGQSRPNPSGGGGANPTGSPGQTTTPQEVAEDTRREQESRSHDPPNRDDYLVSVGRGQQTHG